jgi:hypothetical protein
MNGATGHGRPFFPGARVNERLCHDCAWAAAVSIMECLDGLFREEEKADGFHEVFIRIRSAIQCYVIKSEHEAHRLKPSKN